MGSPADDTFNKAQAAVSSPTAAATALSKNTVLGATPLGAALPAVVGGIESGDPFGGAAIGREQDERFAAALEEAKKAEVVNATKSKQNEVRDLTTTQSGTSQTTFDPRSGAEQGLLDASISNFAQQQALAGQQEASIAGLGALQESGQNVLSGIASGQQFALTPEEQQRIDASRQANIDASSGAVNELLNQRLAIAQADAARRGLRGQAAQELQGQVLGEGARSLERSTLDANRIAADQPLALPGQRVGIQAGVGQGLSTIQQQAQQQAIDNRQLLQDPAALGRLQDERLKGGKTATSSTQNQTGSINTSGTSNSTQTGGAVGGILQDRANAPGEKASKVAVNQSAAGTVAQVGGILGKLAAGGA